MKKSFLVVVFMALFLLACSADYSPDEKVRDYQKSMSVEQAVTILQQSIRGKNSPAGICGSRGFWFDNNSDIRVHRDKITLLSFRRGRQLEKKEHSFDDIVVFEKQYYEYTFDLSRLESINIYDDPLLLPVFPDCSRNDIGDKYYIIDLFIDKSSNLKFIVQSRDFDKTMAAILVLLPEVPVKLR